MTPAEVKQKFAEVFSVKIPPRLFAAPGRVNLIGEHTDYNGGHVFPCALSFNTYAAITPRNDNKVRLYSLNFKNLPVIEAHFFPDSSHI